MTRDQLFIFKMADDVEGGIHRERVLIVQSPKCKKDKILVTSQSEIKESSVLSPTGHDQTQESNDIVFEQSDKLSASLADATKHRLPKEYKKRDLLFAVFSTVLFVADFVSDILLAIQYYKDSEVLLFQLTVCFIVVPSLFSFIINCVWNYMVYTEQSEKHDLDFKITKKLLFLRIFFSLIQFGRLFRYV